MPIAYIVLNDKKQNIEIIFEEIQTGAEPLSDMEYPERLIQLEILPYMQNGKVNYRALEKEAEMIMNQ